jgi:hypothetical protein
VGEWWSGEDLEGFFCGLLSLWHLPGGTEEHHKILMLAIVLAKIWTWHLLNTSPAHYHCTVVFIVIVGDTRLKHMLRSTVFRGVMWRHVVIVYWRSGTAYQSNLQRSGTPDPCIWDWYIVPKMSINNYHSTLHNILEERRSQQRSRSWNAGKNVWCWVTILDN